MQLSMTELASNMEALEKESQQLYTRLDGLRGELASETQEFEAEKKVSSAHAHIRSIGLWV